jgi:hypothetical protein
MTFDENHAVLSALIDREPVDPDALATALEDAAGRAILVDFVRLRVELQREDSSVASDTAPPPNSTRRSRFGSWRLAAAVLLPLAIGMASGWWIGDWSRQQRPPTPNRVVSFTPGVDWNRK